MVRRELDADGSVLVEELIGLIRCTSDRVFNATIWDVLVDPEYQVRVHLPESAPCPTICAAACMQLHMLGEAGSKSNRGVRLLQGKGIGRYMVTRIVESLKRQQIGNICLFADREGWLPLMPGLLLKLLQLVLELLLEQCCSSNTRLVFALQLWDSTSSLASNVILMVSGTNPLGCRARPKMLC